MIYAKRKYIMFSMSKGTLPRALVNNITYNTDIHSHDKK